MIESCTTGSDGTLVYSCQSFQLPFGPAKKVLANVQKLFQSGAVTLPLSSGNEGLRESSTCYCGARTSNGSSTLASLHATRATKCQGARPEHGAWAQLASAAATSRATSAKVLAHSGFLRLSGCSWYRGMRINAWEATMGQAVNSACAISNPGSAGLQPGTQFAHVNTALPRIGLEHEPEERFYPQAYSHASGKVASQGVRLRKMAGVSLEVGFYKV